MPRLTRLNSPALAPLLALFATALWAAHGNLTWRFPPFDGPLDLSLHLLLGLGKLLLILLFPFMLMFLHPVVHRRPAALLKFCLAFLAVFGACFLLHITLTRELLAQFASGETMRYYYLHPGPLDDFHYIGLEAWRAAWSLFIPQSKDFLITLVWLGAVILPLYGLRERTIAVLVATGLGVMVLLIAPIMLGLVVWDYDLFLGGVFWDSLWVDLLPISLPFVYSSSIVLFGFLLVWYASIAAAHGSAFRGKKKIAGAQLSGSEQPRSCGT